MSMEIIAIVGTNSEKSTNRKLLQFIKNHFWNKMDIELIEIKDIPLFNQDINQPEIIEELNKKILNADGVIIATPEYDQSIPACLKSVIEWLSFKVHPLANKPVMIVGASYGSLGSSRAQTHLRQILESMGVNAIPMSGSDFFLSNSLNAFDDDGDLIDKKTIDFLEETVKKFMKFVKVINLINLK